MTKDAPKSRFAASKDSLSGRIEPYQEKPDWLWIAWRYLLNELPPSDLAEFELQLEANEDAQNALVRASCEFQKLTPSPGIPLRQKPAGWYSPKVAIAAASLAAMFLVAVSGTWQLAQHSLPSGQSAEILRKWSNEIGRDQLALIDFSTETSTDSDLLLAQRDDSEIVVPQWLWAAVELERARSLPDRSLDSTNEMDN